jgi:RimJ/RimL family protein N-acetyltransferase
VILDGLGHPHHRIELQKIAVAAPGTGVGRRAMELAIERCFTTHAAHRVWLDLKLYNHRARRVYEALGFVSEGIARESYLYEGEYESLEIMSLLEPEWRARRAGEGTLPGD